MHPVEPELEALMTRLVPGVDQTWEGATERDLAALDEVTLGKLPPFYEWFLRRMGRSMGALASPVQDMRITTILSAYDGSVVYPELNRLLIALHPEDIAPRLSFYLLDRVARDDALVVSCPEGHQDLEGQLRHDFETLREMLAWQLLLRFGVQTRAQVCDVDLYSDGEPVVDVLEPVMTRLGFTSPLATGRYCGLYESKDATMIGNTTARAPKEQKLFCFLGAANVGIARTIIGRIAVETSLRVEASRWRPPLPS